MNGYAGNDQILCERLKAKFASRGAAAVIGGSKPTSELIKKIGSTVSPYEMTAEAVAPRARTAQVTLATKADTRRDNQTANARRTQPKQASTARQARPVQMTTASAYQYDGSYARAYARAADIKARAELVRKDKAKINKIASSAAVAPTRAGVRTSPATVNRTHGAALRAERPTAVNTEVKKKASSFPMEIVVLLAICTVAVILVVYAIAQIYSFTSDIAALKKKQSELGKTESSLMLELSERDDIRLIEKIAVEEIGMVKAEAVEKNHVNILSNDKIDIVAEESTESQGFFSTMLSAIGTGFAKLFE